MRFTFLLLIPLALAACDLADPTGSKGPVDPSKLAPLTSREQSLIYGADGAAQQGNFAAAEQDYMSAVAASTGHIEAHIALARLYDKQKQPQKEAEVLDRALVLQPDNALANYMRGKLYLDDYRYNDALDAFNRGLKQRPDDIDLNTGKGVANDMLGKHTAAQMIYVRAMKVNPEADLTTLRTNLAMSYMLGGTPKKAVDLLQPEVRKPGSSTVTRHNLALAYGMLGRHTEAKKLLNGEIDEETRMLAVARMKEYVRDQNNDINTPPLQPSITEKPAPTDKLESAPAPVKSKPVALSKGSALGKAIVEKEAADKNAAKANAAAANKADAKVAVEAAKPQ